MRESAKAAARAEVNGLKMELAATNKSLEDANASIAELEDLLRAVETDFAACAKALRMAQSAGENGGCARFVENLKRLRLTIERYLPFRIKYMPMAD